MISRAIAVYCGKCVDNFFFWMLVGALALAEPILCSFWPSYRVKAAQVVVLIFATVLFVIQTVGEMGKQNWKQVEPLERELVVKKLFSFVSQGRNMLELICLFTGLFFISHRPGVAAMRCFRVFRLLW